jgi:hypothetical protein
MIHEQSNYVNFAHVEIEGLDKLQVKSVSTYTTKKCVCFYSNFPPLNPLPLHDLQFDGDNSEFHNSIVSFRSNLRFFLNQKGIRWGGGGRGGCEF